MEMEELFTLLAKDYEVHVSKDLHENCIDEVWVVDLVYYNNKKDEDIVDFRGVLGQSLKDLLAHICKEHLKAI